MSIKKSELEELRRKASLYDAKNAPADTHDEKIAKLEAALQEQRVKGFETQTSEAVQREININNRARLEAYEKHLPNFMEAKDKWIDYMVLHTGSLFDAWKLNHKGVNSYVTLLVIAALTVLGLYYLNQNSVQAEAWASSSTGETEIVLGIGLLALVTYVFFFRRR